MSRHTVIAGNWKMYKTVPEAVEFARKLAPLLASSQGKSRRDIYLAVPFTAIQALVDAGRESGLVIGAQNMNDSEEGAFTGEIAARMLLDVGAQFVLLGHSERRDVFGESSSFVNKKVRRALEDGLEPLVCVGEQLVHREQGRTEEIVGEQLRESLAGLLGRDVGRCIIAYEPVWAIGTGKTATPDMAQEAHAFIREFIRLTWGVRAAAKVPILYGGSVKPTNAESLLIQEDVDGLLVGGASLSPESFFKIVELALVKKVEV